MSEHTQRRQRREERWDREKEGKQDRFLKGARTLVLKWEHDDRTLHPRVSRPRAGQGWGGGQSRNSPEAITVTWRERLLARRGSCPQAQAGAGHPLWSRSSAIPGSRASPAKGVVPKGHGGFATAPVGGQKGDARLQRADSRELLQRAGGRGQPHSSWP